MLTLLITRRTSGRFTRASSDGVPARADPHRRIRWIGLLLPLILLLTACGGGEQSMFTTAGKGARDVAGLWWLMFWLSTAVFVVVLILLAVAVFRGEKSREPKNALSKRSRLRMVVLGGIVTPLIIIAVVFTDSFRVLTGFADMRESSDLVVEVVGHQYWWEVNYPESGVVTANEIHVPVGSSITFNLTASDVIHSFWVPSLHGKLDMMPGKNTSITIEPEEVGTYRGQCAQFCGLQHANMAFLVIVEEQEVFDQWLSAQAQPAAEPRADSIIERGRDVYASSACVYCHAIKGTASVGVLGPDLTHLASRETLAAGTLENNPGNLAGWIIDPQHLKPGNAMPAVNLTGEELQAMLEYLNSLD